MSQKKGNQAFYWIYLLPQSAIISDNYHLDIANLSVSNWTCLLMKTAVSVWLFYPITNNSVLFYSLPYYKISDWSKLRAFADDKINVNQKLKFVFGKSRKHRGKRRKCWLPAFSPFPTMFSKDFFFKVVRIRKLCSKELIGSVEISALEILWEKKKNARCQHFSFSHTDFYSFTDRLMTFFLSFWNFTLYEKNRRAF